MFDKKTVLVVGAGASCECNLPMGAALRSDIAKLMRFRFDYGRHKEGDMDLLHAMEVAAQNETPPSQDPNPYLVEAAHINKAVGQAISIDNFIDSHRGNERLERCGKMAIVRAILQGEKGSSLYIDPRESNSGLNFAKLDSTWYGQFFKLLTENCRADELIARLSTVALVVFNYDRCIEHFLFHALKNYYRLSAEEAATVLKSLAIYHPYGSVGRLPWQGGTGVSEYGGEPRPQTIYDLSKLIRTFTEGTNESSSDIQEIRGAMGAASLVVFLGFAFHRLNLALLKPTLPKLKPRDVKCFGTAFGISVGDCEVIAESLATLVQVPASRIFLRNDLRCEPFFAEHWHRLSLG